MKAERELRHTAKLQKHSLNRDTHRANMTHDTQCTQRLPSQAQSADGTLDLSTKLSAAPLMHDGINLIGRGPKPGSPGPTRLPTTYTLQLYAHSQTRASPRFTFQLCNTRHTRLHTYSKSRASSIERASERAVQVGQLPI